MKVFGTGLPRSGTTSMAIALLHMGFRTAHCCFDDQIYVAADAVFDTPVFADYPLLDRRFPGSKFIHTKRDFDPWFESVNRTLGTFLGNLALGIKGPTAEVTKSYDIDRRCWLQTFGTLRIERETFRRRFEAHESAIAEYFRDRPRDFISFHLPANELWPRLAGFLGRGIPPGEFPHANRGTAVDWIDFNHPNKMPSMFEISAY